MSGGKTAQPAWHPLDGMVRHCLHGTPRLPASPCVLALQSRNASISALSLLGSPAPTNLFASTLHCIHSSPPIRSTPGKHCPSKFVPTKSIVTSQPGLSTVSICTPNACSQAPLHCVRYQAVSLSSGSTAMPNFDLNRQNTGYPQRKSLNKVACHLRKVFEINQLVHSGQR